MAQEDVARLKLSLTQEYSNINLNANLATKNQKTLIMMMSTPVCQEHPPETDVVTSLVLHMRKLRLSYSSRVGSS